MKGTWKYEFSLWRDFMKDIWKGKLFRSKHLRKYYWVWLRRTIAGSRFRYRCRLEEYKAQMSERRKEDLESLTQRLKAAKRYGRPTPLDCLMFEDGWFYADYLC